MTDILYGHRSRENGCWESCELVGRQSMMHLRETAETGKQAHSRLYIRNERILCHVSLTFKMILIPNM